MQEDQRKRTKKVFEDRKRAFEAKYQQDEEIRFKTRIRSNKLAGQWAAGALGLTGEEAKTYVAAVLDLGFSDASGEKLFAKLTEDLKAHGKAMGEHALRTEILKLGLLAEEQIMNEIMGDDE